MVFPVRDFSGGINTRYSPTRLQPNEVVDCLNFHLEARGGVYRRKGYIPYIEGETGSPITGLYQFRTVDENYTLRVQNGAFEWDNAGAWTDATGAETLSADKNDRCVFSTYRKHAIFTDGVNPPLKWDGSGNVAQIERELDATGDTLDRAATLVLHDNRIIYGDVTLNESSSQTRYESRIYPADLGTIDGLSVDPDGMQDISEGDGDSVSCLLDVMGFLVVFKQNSFYRVEHFADAGIQNTKRVAAVGTPGPHSAIGVGPYIYFLDSYGQLWVYDARGTNTDSMRNLSEEKLGESTLNQFQKARLKYAHLYYHPARNEIYCFLSQDPNWTDVAWVFNRTTGGFVRHVFADDFNIVAPYIDDNGQAQFMGGTFDGGVYQLDQGLRDADPDTGEIPTAFVLTQHYDMESINIVKGYRDIDIYSTISAQQEVTVEHLLDGAPLGDTYTVQLDPNEESA